MPKQFDPTREVEVAKHLARALGWSYIDLQDYVVSSGVLKKVPAEFACRQRCVPVVFNQHRLVIVVDDPYSGAYVMANSNLFGAPYDRPVKVALTTRRAMDHALHRRICAVR
jgi:hypothetical protein